MSEVSTAPDISAMPLPMDVWTEPFWQAAARKELIMPKCGSCGTFRWPPGPFCPECRSQEVAWVPAGPGRIYSYTVLRRPGPKPEDPVQVLVPALIEFPDCGGMRFMAALVGAPLDEVQVGAAVAPGWSPKGAFNVPVFSLA